MKDKSVVTNNGWAIQFEESGFVGGEDGPLLFKTKEVAIYAIRRLEDERDDLKDLVAVKVNVTVTVA